MTFRNIPQFRFAPGVQEDRDRVLTGALIRTALLLAFIIANWGPVTQPSHDPDILAHLFLMICLAVVFVYGILTTFLYWRRYAALGANAKQRDDRNDSSDTPSKSKGCIKSGREQYFIYPGDFVWLYDTLQRHLNTQKPDWPRT